MVQGDGGAHLFELGNGGRRWRFSISKTRSFSRLGFEDFGGDSVTGCGGLYRRRNLAEGQGFLEILLGTASVIKPALCPTREGHELRLEK